MSNEKETVANTPMSVPMKPLPLKLRDAKLDIVNSVNKAMRDYNLPAYLLRGLLEEVLTTVKEVEKQELTMAEAQYAKEMEQFEKK